MTDTFNNLNEANVELYDEHPVLHTAAAVVVVVGVIVGTQTLVHKVMWKMHKREMEEKQFLPR
jgi:hypothetical protein